MMKLPLTREIRESMPVSVAWDNDAHTIIRYHVQDPWQLDEYAQALESTWTMIESV